MKGSSNEVILIVVKVAIEQGKWWIVIIITILIRRVCEFRKALAHLFQVDEQVVGNN